MKYLFHSPFGAITYDWDGKVCQHIWLDQQSETIHSNLMSQWFKAYFLGESPSLPPLSKPPTPFQAKLRIGLLNIPAGEVRTYGELAKTLASSPRGLGQALGANCFPIVIPCHRVIAASGLGGFAYGSTWKKKLLNLEKS